MKKLLLAIFIITAINGSELFAQPRATIETYILKYREIAVEEMRRTGVPAAITIAQGIHETGAGTSDLVLKSNNHFGIKCKTEWGGDRVYHDDDARGECFRKYNDPTVSYRDHSDFLKTRPIYASLFSLDPTDYEAWAFGLKKAGYATNPKYPQILIQLIRDYNLQEYSLIALGKKPAYPSANWAKETEVITEPQPAAGSIKTVYPAGVFKINDTKVVFIQKGTSYLKIAEENDISLSRLFDFNDMKELDVAPKDGLLFLQRKRKKGATEFHTVTKGEALYDIAQTEGIRAESLLQYNFLTPGMQVEEGEKLYLGETAPNMPKLATEKKTMPKAYYETSETQVENISGNNYSWHVVQSKETIYSIAKKYEVSIDDVKRWNDLTENDLKIGQQVRIKQTK